MNFQLGCRVSLVARNARESIQLMLQAMQLQNRISFVWTMRRIAFRRLDSGKATFEVLELVTCMWGLCCLGG